MKTSDVKNKKRKPYLMSNKRYKDLRLQTCNDKKDRCYTVRELADLMTGATKSSYYSRISQIESGDVKPSPADMRYYHNYFNVSYEYLMGDSDNKYYENYSLGKEFNISDDVIKTLRRWKKEEDCINYIPFLNQLFSMNDTFDSFIIDFHRYIFGKPTAFIEYKTGKNGETVRERTRKSIQVANEKDDIECELAVEHTEYIYERKLLDTMTNLKKEMLSEHSNKIGEYTYVQ